MSSKESRSCGSPRRCSHFHPPMMHIYRKNPVYFLERITAEIYRGAQSCDFSAGAHLRAPDGEEELLLEHDLGAHRPQPRLEAEGAGAHHAPLVAVVDQAPAEEFGVAIVLPRPLSQPQELPRLCDSHGGWRMGGKASFPLWEDAFPCLSFHFISFHFCPFSSHKGAPARILRGPRSRGNPSRPRCACCSSLRVVTTLGLS
jgi:hypothetical protein